MDLNPYIARIPDFPKPGILFYDISPLLAHGAAWQETIRRLAAMTAAAKPDLIVGIESRGFLLAAPLAAQLGIGFAMIRKSGKLPGAVLRREYALEYGTNVLELQSGLVQTGQKIVVVDDVLATGGTMRAAMDLLQDAGAEIRQALFLIELLSLAGREKIATPCQALLSY
jgi:adenine phosphoribosyltransferase